MTSRRAQLSMELYLDLLRVHERLHGTFAVLFREHGLSHAQYNTLRILRGAGEALPCSVIAERLVTRDPDVTRLVDRMERQGLVERTRSQEDRRVVLVALTRAGRSLVDALDQPVLDLHESTLGGVGLARLRELRGLLGEVLEATASPA